MRKRRRVLPIITLCLCTIATYGQQKWQGNAAVARSGEFATPGMVAASNAFPENTTILVQNAQSGQSVQVTVVQRIQGAASVFLLLCEEAGKRIGLTGSQVIRVQASVVSTPGADLTESLREDAYSTDPDLNPALSIAEQQLLSGAAGPEGASGVEEPAAVEEKPVEVAQTAPPESEQEAEPSAEAVEEGQALPAAEEQEPLLETAAGGQEIAVEGEPETVAEVAGQQQPAQEQPVEIAGAPAETPASTEPTPEEKRLRELTDRIPQKQLYMPPRQQEVYALAPEEQPVEEEIAAVEQPIEEVAEVVEEQPPAEEVAEVEEAIAQEAEPQIAEEEPAKTIEVAEEGPPEASMPGPEMEEEALEVALPGPEAAEPEKPSPEGTRLPAPEEQPPLTVAPEEPPTGGIAEAAAEEQIVETTVTEEQPTEEVAAAEAQTETVEQVVEEKPLAEVAMAEAPAEEAPALSETLPSRTYFVQLGAYSTRNLAEKLAGELTRSYSVTILPASSAGRYFYKVLVGPLNVDESGTLLYQFRSRGFKDAFIQYVE